MSLNFYYYCSVLVCQTKHCFFLMKFDVKAKQNIIRVCFLIRIMFMHNNLIFIEKLSIC